MDHTEKLARFLHSVPDIELPDAVVERAKIHILDTIGVAIGGSQTPHARQSNAMIRALGSTGHITVIASSETANVLDAAFLNGVFAHAIDFDDAHRFVHAGAAVVPTALAFAQYAGASGRDFLASVVAGYEGSVRVSLAGGPAHRKRGYHPTGTCNVVGATASAAVLMKLNPEQTVSAIGIACSQAAGLTQYRIDGAATKHLHAGFAARSGGASVLLAREGLRGTASAIDGELGFLNVLADGGEPERLTAGLGESFAVATSDIKPFPSCRQTHAPVDLSLKIRGSGVRAEAIDDVELRTYAYCDKPWHVTTEPPSTSLEAMLNIPYCIAMALSNGRLTLADFSDEALARKDIHALMKKIRIVVDEGLTAVWPGERGAILNITASGQIHSGKATNPRGGVDSPLDFAEIVTKFEGLSIPVLGQEKTEAIVQSVRTIERAPDLDTLCGHLASKVTRRQAEHV